MSKSKTQSVGSLWELDVESDRPVVFVVTGPTGTSSVNARPGDTGHKKAEYVLDAEGEFTAVAEIKGAADVDGFAVTAK